VFAAASPPSFEILATFDYSQSAANAFASAINDKGDVAGSYGAESGAVRGFVRLSNGRLSGPIIHPDEQDHFSGINGINNLKTLCGYYFSMKNQHSFLLSGGTFTDITTIARETEVFGVNDAGNVCGITTHPDAAFVIIGGTATLFTIPGSSYNLADGINNLDQCVGFYVNEPIAAGFRRDADGTLTYPITAPGSPSTTALAGINDSGSMVGVMVDTAGVRAVFFDPSGRSTVYDYPGATSTRFSGINNKGMICATYDDGNGTHSFIVRVRLRQ